MELLDQLTQGFGRPSSVQTHRRKLAHATAKLKQTSHVESEPEAHRRPLELEVLEASTSGRDTDVVTTARLRGPRRRRSATVAEKQVSETDGDDDILSSLMRTRRWSSPGTGHKTAGSISTGRKTGGNTGTGNSPGGKKSVSNGVVLPPLNLTQSANVRMGESRGVKKAWSGKEAGAETKEGRSGFRIRSPLAPVSNLWEGPDSERGRNAAGRANRLPTSATVGPENLTTRGRREFERDSRQPRSVKAGRMSVPRHGERSRNEQATSAKAAGNETSTTRQARESESDRGPSAEANQGEPCRCKNCLECILRPRKPRRRKSNGPMMVTLSLPDDEGWAIREAGGEIDGSSEEGELEYECDSNESEESSGWWSGSEDASGASGRGSRVDRPLTLEELEREPPMEEYHPEKLELWFRSQPPPETEVPTHEAVAQDIKRMFRRNPLMRPGKATRETFRRLASPREASEQMNREEAALVELESQHQRKGALRAYILKQRAHTAKLLAARREAEDCARAEARAEAERRATLRRLVGGYVAVEARRKLRAYQTEQQKRLQKAAKLRQNPATWHQF